MIVYILVIWDNKQQQNCHTLTCILAGVAENSWFVYTINIGQLKIQKKKLVFELPKKTVDLTHLDTLCIKIFKNVA